MTRLAISRGGKQVAKIITRSSRTKYRLRGHAKLYRFFMTICQFEGLIGDISISEEQNADDIRNVYRRSVVLCRELKVFAQGLVAIDGSGFKASNTCDGEPDHDSSLESRIAYPG
jgi:hypothetical protein